MSSKQPRVNVYATHNEIMALAIFTKEELSKDIATLQSLVKYAKDDSKDVTAFTNRKLNGQAVALAEKINANLPLLQHNYLNESVDPLKSIFLLLCEYIRVAKANNDFDTLFLTVIDNINNFFVRFHIPEGLSLSRSPPSPSGDDRSLQQRVLNPNNLSNNPQYKQLVKEIVQSTDSKHVTSDYMKAIADQLLSEQNGHTVCTLSNHSNPIDDLLIASVSHLHQRQAELKEYKVSKLIQLSNKPQEISLKEQRRRRILELAKCASTSIIND
jgi:hypothetical protein